MKTMAILFSLLLVAATSFAADWELDKGAVELGGSIMFSSASGDLYEYDGDGLTTFGIMPEVQYFIAPTFSLGGMISFLSLSQGDYSVSTFGIGPALYKYFGNSDGKTWPFVGAAFMFQSTSMSNGDDEKITGTTIHFTGGIAHKLVDHYILKAGLYFDMDSMKGDWDDAESESGSVFGLSVGFAGFVY